MIETTGLHHVGIPVSSMERSLAFYEEMLGVVPDFVAEGSGDELSEALGVPDAVLSFAFLRVGSATLELLEYEHPRGRPYDRGNADVGAIHVALRVPDIDEAYRDLADRGVAFNAPPFRIEEGPLAGCAFAYFADPDGVQLELFQDATGHRPAPETVDSTDSRARLHELARPGRASPSPGTDDPVESTI